MVGPAKVPSWVVALILVPILTRLLSHLGGRGRESFPAKPYLHSTAQAALGARPAPTHFPESSLPVGVAVCDFPGKDFVVQACTVLVGTLSVRSLLLADAVLFHQVAAVKPASYPTQCVLLYRFFLRTTHVAGSPRRPCSAGQGHSVQASLAPSLLQLHWLARCSFPLPQMRSLVCVAGSGSRREDYGHTRVVY